MRARLPALALLVACLGGCGDSDRVDVLPHPTGYHPELFPDLRMPPDYVARADQDQLAVVVAGGAVRRYDVSLISKPRTKVEPPENAMAWFARTLPTMGWEAVGAAGDRERRWRHAAIGERDAEDLLVETGSSGGRTTIHVRLTPAAAAR